MAGINQGGLAAFWGYLWGREIAWAVGDVVMMTGRIAYDASRAWGYLSSIHHNPRGHL